MFAYDKISIIFIIVLTSIYDYITVLGCEIITYHLFKDTFSTYCQYLMGLLLAVIQSVYLMKCVYRIRQVSR